MEISHIKKQILKKYPDVYKDDENLEGLLNKIRDMESDLQDLLSNLLLDKPHNEIKVEGYDLETLKSKFNMNDVSAVLTLDWLRREPKIAKETLEKGFDRVF